MFRADSPAHTARLPAGPEPRASNNMKFVGTTHSTSYHMNTTDEMKIATTNARPQAECAAPASFLPTKIQALCGKRRAGVCFILRAED
jgi:hypothetical protein